MSSDPVMIENLSSTNGSLPSAHNTFSGLYSAFETRSPSPNLSQSSTSNSTPSPSSLSPSNKTTSESLISQRAANPLLSSSQRKDVALKLPYPVLSDHRDPSSVLVLLQKETHTTSKKIFDVTKQIDQCERRLNGSTYTDNEKKAFKHDRVKLKQQLDALKKHERRVSLQIDFVTTKTEIKGLEDEHKQMHENATSDESQQIKILLGKLKQKLEKMKVYMRARNEEMKKMNNGKQRSNACSDQKSSTLSSSQKASRFNSSSMTDSNRKRPATSENSSLTNKRSKPAAPLVRLSSRATNHDSKKHAVPPPIVRFVNKTTESAISSASPTTPASSSSTLSPPLLARASTGSTNLINHPLQQHALPLVNDDDDDDDDELHLELNIDELFEDDPYADQSVQRLKPEMSKTSRLLPVSHSPSTTRS